MLRLGVCSVPYVWHGWLAPVPTLVSWKAVRAIGVTDVRLQFDVSLASPAPGTWDTSLFENFLRPILAAGLTVNANYVSGTTHPYDDETFHQDAAYRLAMQFGDVITEFSPGNEPGGDPQMANDISNGGTVDFIRETYTPFVTAFAKGIRRARPYAIIDAFDSDSADIHTRCMDVANELLATGLNVCDRETVHPYGDVGGASYATMERFAEVLGSGPARRPWYISEIDDQQFPGGADTPATLAAGRPLKLIPFIETTAAKYPDSLKIVLGTPEYFFERGTTPAGLGCSSFNLETPIVSAMGEKFQATIAKVSGEEIITIEPGRGHEIVTA